MLNAAATPASPILRRLLVGLIGFFALAPASALALPGEVLDEQKISATAGGFGGTLSDNDQFGIAAEGIGDLDGDGVEDVAVGAWNDDTGGNDRGAVWILFLNSDGTVADEQKIDQTSGGFGGTLGDTGNFGGSLAALGDLDGDGVGDLAVSAHNDDAAGTNRGAVWILFLNPDGTVKDEQRLDPGISLQDGDAFGFGLSAIGDLDGDGHTELAVGAFGDDDGTIDAGAVWILFLLPDGTVHHQQKISETDGNLGVDLDDDRFGIRTAGLGDLDGDGVPDLAVGADLDDDGGTDRGAVYVLLLETDGTVKDRQKISDTDGGFTGVLADSDLFGFGVAGIGDVDGDLVADLAVGALGDNDGGNEHGAVWVLFLDTDGTVAGHQKISDLAGGFGGAIGADRFGAAIGGLGDLDGDGIGDLAVGAYFADDGGDDRGAVWILNLDGTVLTCGDAVLDPTEECDDGGMASLDGCSATCEIEDDLELFGIAGGTGLLSVAVEQLSVNVSVLSGDTPPLLAQLLAVAINGNPTLMALGTSAQAAGNTVVTNGTFGTGEITATDTAVSVNPGTVTAHQKISSTRGGFTGSLDDGDRFGWSVASIGDLNGDGIGDLVVGAPRDDDGGFNNGALWVLNLEMDGSVKGVQKISELEGGLPAALFASDNFGVAVTSLGDLDGDGIVDLAVGADGVDDGGSDRGAVWVLLLNADGTVKDGQKIGNGLGGFTGVLDDQDAFGTSLASLGDLDGDGVGDLAVGAEDDDSSRGSVWILFLDTDGTVKSHQKISNASVGFAGNLDPGDNFGSSVAALGDLDGDGIGDLAVGARLDADGVPFSGAAWVLFLDTDGTVDGFQKISDGTGGFTAILTDPNGFGSGATSPGDLDGDGIGDLIVGAFWDSDGDKTDAGAAFALFLNPNGTVKGYRKISATQGGFTGTLGIADVFGVGVASLGDLDGDGRTEVAVGASGDDDGGDGRGAVWVLSLDSATLSYCGDAVVVLPETCDDGNVTPGDGCYSTCEAERELEIVGTAQGGTLQVVVSGVAVLIATSAGQSAETIASNLSGVINIVPDLQSQGVSSAPVTYRVVTNGTFDDVVVMDAGITVLPEPGSALMLGSGALLLLYLDARRRRRGTL